MFGLHFLDHTKPRLLLNFSRCGILLVEQPVQERPQAGNPVVLVTVSNRNGAVLVKVLFVGAFLVASPVFGVCFAFVFMFVLPSIKLA